MPLWLCVLSFSLKSFSSVTALTTQSSFFSFSKPAWKLLSLWNSVLQKVRMWTHDSHPGLIWHNSLCYNAIHLFPPLFSSSHVYSKHTLVTENKQVKINRHRMPGWLSGWASAFGSGRDPGVPGLSPTSDSLHEACFSLCPCLCLSLCVTHDK